MVHPRLKLKRKNLIYALIIFISLLSVSLYFIPMNLPNRVQHAQALMSEIYQDPEQVYLADNISVHKIQDLVNVTNRLTGELGQELQAKANLTLCKFRNLQKLKQLVNLDKTVLMDSQLKEVTLNAELTPEIWQENKELYLWPERDAFTEQVDHAYDLVEATWLPLNQAYSLINSLPEQPSQENPKVLDQVQAMLTIEDLLTQASDSNLKDKLDKQYHQKVDQYMKKMISTKQSYGEEVLLNLYQADAVLPYIIDTPLDYRPKVAVTFDDGPNEDFTPQILDILDKYQIKATFFVVGRNVDQVPEVAQEIIARGHDIGNHSYSHPTFLEMTDDEILWEINATQDIIENHTGYRPKLYRMPFGDGGRHVYELIDNLTSTMWNTDTNDWYFETPQEIYDYTVPQLDRDMLMLMHDTSQKSVDAFDQILQTLVDQNYKFVSPDELEYAERYRELGEPGQYE